MLNSANFQIVKVATVTDVPSSFPNHVCYHTLDDQKYFIWRNNLLEEVFVDSNGGIGNIVTNILYADLLDLWSNTQLVPGAYYRITDFQTIYDQPDYDSSGAALPAINIVTKYGPIEPLIVQAITFEEFSPDAYQESFLNDRIKFKFRHFTAVKNVLTKGRITERIDSNGNKTSYDHRAVVFKRYFQPREVGSTHTTPYGYIALYNQYQEYSTGPMSYNIVTNNRSLTDNMSYYPVFYYAYVCTTAGTRNFGSGNITVAVGDWLVYESGIWTKMSNTEEFYTFGGKPTNGDATFNNVRNNTIGIEFESDTPLISPIYGMIDSLPNIVFNDIYPVIEGNNFKGALSCTFKGELNVGNIIETIHNVCLTFTFKYNKISVFQDVFWKGNISLNNVKRMSDLYGVGEIRGNAGDLISDVFTTNSKLSIANIRENNISQIFGLYLQDAVALLLESNNGKNIDNISFYSWVPDGNGAPYFQFKDNNFNSISTCNFTQVYDFSFCNIDYITNTNFFGTFLSNKGLRIEGSTFRGMVAYTDFGPFVSACDFGPNFGLPAVQQGLEFTALNTSSDLGGNIFTSAISNCQFGSGITGNNFKNEIHNLVIPDNFQNNTVDVLIKNENLGQFLMISSIPELITPMTTHLTSKTVKLDTSLITAGYINELLFDTVDIRGNSRFWFLADSILGSVGVTPDPRPFSMFTDILLGVTSTTVGSGLNNTLEIAKIEQYAHYEGTQGICSALIGGDTSKLPNIAVPSIDELVIIANYLNPTPTGFGSIYWSSTEVSATHAYAVDFSTNTVVTVLKTNLYGTYPIVYFSYTNIPVLKYTDDYGATIVRDLTGIFI